MDNYPVQLTAQEWGYVQANLIGGMRPTQIAQSINDKIQAQLVEQWGPRT